MFKEHVMKLQILHLADRAGRKTLIWKRMWPQREENNVCASCQERFLWRSPNLQLSLSLLTLPTPGRPSANQCQDPPSYTRQQLEVQTLDVCYTLPVLVSVNSTISTSENLPLCVPFLPRAVHCVGSSRISTVS